MKRRRKFAALVALALLSGCAPRARISSGPEPVYHTMGPLELSATLEQEGVDVIGSIDIMNTSRKPVLVEYESGCAVTVIVVGDSKSLWDQSVWWSAHPNVCPEGNTSQLEIPPRTLARILTPATTTREIAGDSIPRGIFPTAVRLRMMQPRDTTLVLSAGPVRLES